MFDEGQHLPSPYHRTKFESEKIVRERGHRAVARLPAGDRRRPLRDRRHGQGRRALLLLPARSSCCATACPAWLPLVGVDLGDTNVVPVDYVAEGHGPPRPPRGPRRRGLPPGQPRAAAGRRRWSTRSARPPARRSSRRPLDRGTAGGLLGAAPRPAAPAAPGQQRWSAPRPAQAAARPDRRPARHPAPRCSRTRRSARSSTRAAPRRRWPAPGIAVPDLEWYARTLWGYWEEHLDQSTGRDAGNREALDRASTS